MGYSEKFLGDTLVSVPQLDKNEKNQFEDRNLLLSDYFLDYENFSLLQNPFRKFPYYTAANINGELFKKISRNHLFSGSGDKWTKDPRIPKNHQLGKELYSAEKSDFDKGHLTKREDVQWGKDKIDAKRAAESTFFYTNAIPQLDRLNRGIWRRIEDYILHEQTVLHSLKISMITGPVFDHTDPYFVTKVDDESIQIPCLFWKVIYYLKNERLHRTAFLTNQEGLLRKRKIVKPRMRGELPSDIFMNFKDAETYQVQVNYIEKISGLTFEKAEEVFVEDTPEELIVSEVDVRPSNTRGVVFRDGNEERKTVKINLVL